MAFKIHRKKEGGIYSSLVNGSSDAMYIISKMNFEYVNPAFENLIGYAANEICSAGFDLLQLIHPDDRKRVLESMEAVPTGVAAPSLHEFRILGKDGRIRYVEANVSALPENGGKRLGIIREITARKAAEQSLQESEEKYRHLVERANDGIAIVQDSLLKYINPKAAEIAGYTPDELINTPFSRYLAAESVPDSMNDTEQKTPEKDISGILDAFAEHKQGTKVRIELNSGRIQYQGKPALLILIRDITDRQRIEEELSRTLENLRKAMGATIQAMSLTIETRDPYTAGHQKRVSDLARAIATEMKLPQEDIDAIRMAASIHDLGKISIPAEILSKPGRISEFEFRLIQNHPKIGFEILRTIDFPWPIADIVLQHHERMNGSGYPNGLTGEKILPVARILAVADVVEAMVSHRPYRSALTLGEAIHEISKNRNILYDADAVDACKRLFIEGRFAFMS